MKIELTQLGTPKVIQTSRGQAEKNWCKAKEEGDKFLNFWVNNYTRTWKVGTVVDVDKIEEREYTKKEGQLAKSYDIKFATREDKIAEQLKEINSRLMKVSLMVEKIGQHLMPPKDEIPYPEGEPDEVSF